MEDVARYLFSLCCAGMICGVLCSLVHGTMEKMLCGIFLAFFAISPLKELDFSDIAQEIAVFPQDARAASAVGSQWAEQEILNSISENCASYILTEAARLGAEVSVTVTVDPESRLPVSVELSGTVTPYARQHLTAYITQIFGIPKEEQRWNSP